MAPQHDRVIRTYLVVIRDKLPHLREQMSHLLAQVDAYFGSMATAHHLGDDSFTYV